MNNDPTATLNFTDLNLPTSSPNLPEPKPLRAFDGLSSDEMAFEEPEVLHLPARFRIVGPLGRGGMGVVYEAYDLEMGRRVAVKRPHLDPLPSRATIERFFAEAILTGQLQHPNIVPVYSCLRDSLGMPFFVMKKVVGQTLSDVLKSIRAGDPVVKAAWDRHRCLSVFEQICLAVGFAHDHGVLHRDLKLANIMIGHQGEVYVMDWGVAGVREHMREQAASIDEIVIHHQRPGTRVGTVIGTQSYLSPEQARKDNGAVGKPSDVWCLGLILAELFARETIYSQPLDLQFGPGVAQRLRKRAVPEGVVDIVARCLRPEPAERFSDASRLAAQVRKVLNGEERRRRAFAELEESQRALHAHHEALQAERRLFALLESMEDSVPSWKPLDSPEKCAQQEAREDYEAVLLTLDESFNKAMTCGERALSHDPGSEEVRAILADIYWVGYAQADERNDRRSRALFESRIRAMDVDAVLRRLDWVGALSLDTVPSGAEVLLQRVEQSGLIWSMSDPVCVGVTPLQAHTLPQGSYVLTLKKPGYADTTYPVLISRLRDWDGGRVRLFRPEQIPAGMAYVPGGPALLGSGAGRMGRRILPRFWADVPGFFVSQHHITQQEYCEFMNDIPRDEATARLPRTTEFNEPLWEAPGDGEPFAFPDVDADGTRWEGSWPIIGVSYTDAEAYLRWRSLRDGRTLRLLAENEWSKAARGADGRRYPWGRIFDATLCLMEDSDKECSQPKPVGTYPLDRSVYGVCDVAGSVREWVCGVDNVPSGFRLMRGGGFAMSVVQCDLSNRFWARPPDAASYLSFRVACDLPEEE